MEPNSVIVTDDVFSSQDLSGGEDRDTTFDRGLVIRWEFPQTDYKEFHVYMKDSSGEYLFLGREPTGAGRMLVWREDAGMIAPRFREGPHFGESYQFRVFGVTQGGRPPFRGPIENGAPVEFRSSPLVPAPTPEEPAPSPSPTVTPSPTLTPTSVPTETPPPPPIE